MGVVETQPNMMLDNVELLYDPTQRMDTKFKKCKFCGEVKLLEDFSISGRRKDGTIRRKNECKKCRNQKNIEYTKLVKQLGLGGKITPSHPNGVITSVKSPPLGTPCENCGKKEQILYFEHDHVTMVHRGWLCNQCNMGFAFLGDNMEGLMESSKYLAKSMTKEEFEKPIRELLKWSREKNDEEKTNSERS
tara:strand:- start:85 stop:657 length:573 start_codon:yes stop_codon:yes gene_type:complete